MAATPQKSSYFFLDSEALETVRTRGNLGAQSLLGGGAAIAVEKLAEERDRVGAVAITLLAGHFSSFAPIP